MHVVGNRGEEAGGGGKRHRYAAGREP
jgi:hypothetical protein